MCMHHINSSQTVMAVNSILLIIRIGHYYAISETLGPKVLLFQFADIFLIRAADHGAADACGSTELLDAADIISNWIRHRGAVHPVSELGV